MKTKQLPVANMPCDLCNKHEACIVESSRDGTKRCGFWQDWRLRRFSIVKDEDATDSPQAN
jgi:hypothetical protein